MSFFYKTFLLLASTFEVKKMSTKLWIILTASLVIFSCQSKMDTDHQDKLINKKINTMNIQYAYTILYVEDVAKTIEFYNSAFGFEQKFLTPEKDYGEVVSGSTTLAFGNYELGESNLKKGFQKSNLKEKPFGIELAFTTLEVEKVMENAIKNGASQLAETVTNRGDRKWDI